MASDHLRNLVLRHHLNETSDRHDLYLQARERNPLRWSQHTRNWSPIDAVTLNPERDSIVKEATHTQLMAA